MSRIDPLQSLAFSIHGNPGVYALLLGSGVSRSAGIPTGWEIVLDLLGKLAATCGGPTETNLEHWYVSKYKEAPDYAKILDSLAKTQSERQQLLRPYFEANDQEREEKLKQPTTAHQAIAQLVAQGFVKVIITTNFDRLMEKALEDVGVVPTVLSSVDQVQGALPLIHLRCCVLKIHGDYLDTRIRNSPQELEVYSKEFDELLDRIFDEFGLIVCGWSADWDVALRKAVARTSSRRFTTYWAVHGPTNDQAQRLMDNRRAETIQINNADQFFETIQQTVQSIEEFAQPHPLSTEAAIASFKRYLSAPGYRIQLKELVDTTVDSVVAATSGDAFSVQGGPSPIIANATARIRKYEAACTTLISMASIAGFWAEEDNCNAWERAIERLFTTTSSSGNVVWLGLRTYPAILLLYSLGLGAVEAERLTALNRIFGMQIRVDSNSIESTPVLNKLLLALVPFYQYKLLEGMENHYAPISDWLHDALRTALKRLISDDDRYTYVFDKFEIIASLAYYRLNKDHGGRPLAGAFLYRATNRRHILTTLQDSIKGMGSDSPIVTSGICGKTPEECTATVDLFIEHIDQMVGAMGIPW